MIFWSSFPFVRLVIPFGVGIFLGLNFSLGLTPAIVVSLFGLLIGLVLLHIFNRSFKANYVTGILISTLFIGLGVGYSSMHTMQETRGVNDVPTNTVWLGKVQSVKQKEGKAQSLVVQIQKFKKNDSWENVDFKLLVYNKDSLFDPHVGDLIAGEGKLVPTMSPQNPAQFNYQRFLESKNIYLTSFEDEFIKLKSNNSLIRYAEMARASIIQIYKELKITDNNLAVLVALTLGDKSYLDAELQQQYAGAGAMHILAVSGLHVGIVFLIFNFLLSKLPDGLSYRIIQTVTLLLVIWAFAFLAGLSPSVQRAGWMFSFVIISKLLKRNSNVLNSIAVSAFLLLLLDPNNLFQVGFQLSYSAVIGIVLIHPVVYKLLYWPNWLMDKVWSLLVVSFAAQIATLPFTLAYFHQFPNYFLVANLLVIPLAFGIVLGSVIIVCLFLLFNSDLYLASILDWLLTALNESILFVTAIPGAMSEGIWMSELSILFLIGAIISFLIFIYHKAVKAFTLVLCFIIGIQITELLATYEALQTKQITFYAFKNPAWSVIKGRTAEIYLVEGVSDYDKKIVNDHMNLTGVNELKWDTIEEATSKVLSIGNKSMLLFPEPEVEQVLQATVDIVVPSSNSELSAMDKTMVLDYFYRSSEELTLLEQNSNYYNFRKDNAFIVSF